MDEKLEEIAKSVKSPIKDNNRKLTKSHSLALKFLKKKSLNPIAINNKLFERFNHRNSEIIPVLNYRMNPLKNCILALSFSKDIRNNNPSLLNCIESYLKTLKGFMNIISNEQSKYTMEEKIKQISINMAYEYYTKNTVMFKYGEKGDKFYIILKGKIGFLIPKKVKCNLTEEEYLTNLLKFYQNGEYELVKNILRINQPVFDFGEDLEKYITETINEFYNRNKKYKYSMEVYTKLIELSSNNFKIKNNSNTNNINIQTYIEMNKISNGDHSLKNKRPVVLYNYQYVNNYEDGQTFGYMALENRSNKRTSTAVTITDCELATLNKEEYFELLGGVHHKTRNNIYDLISSLKVLGNISKPTFDYDVIHKIKFINYKINEMIMEENKNLSIFYIFYSGSFKLSVNKNIAGLNELAIKLKKIRGKILNLPNDIIQKDITDHLLEINGSIVNKKYSDESIKKEYLKKHNFIISIITDNFLLGLPDTVDPETNLTLFNCSCISNYCDGYEISNKVLKMLCKGERYKFNNDVMQMSLTKINYYINRIIHYKNTLLSKIKDMEVTLHNLDKSINRQKNISNPTKIINTEPKHYKPISNEKTNYLIKRNSLTIKNKQIKIDNVLASKTLTNFKSNKTPKTKNIFNLKFISFPNIDKNKYSKSINPPNKRKNGKKINTKIYKIKKNKDFEKIFNIKDGYEEDNLKNESKDNSINLKDIKDIDLLDEENISDKEIKRKRKKEKLENIKIKSKYYQIYKLFEIKQKDYKNNMNNNTNNNIFNPVDEQIKSRKFSLFKEYKNFNDIKLFKLDEENKNNVNSVNTMNNIDYFLSKERKMKDSIFLNI